MKRRKCFEDFIAFQTIIFGLQEITVKVIRGTYFGQNMCSWGSLKSHWVMKNYRKIFKTLAFRARFTLKGPSEGKILVIVTVSQNIRKPKSHNLT